MPCRFVALPFLIVLQCSSSVAVHQLTEHSRVDGSMGCVMSTHKHSTTNLPHLQRPAGLRRPHRGRARPRAHPRSQPGRHRRLDNLGIVHGRCNWEKGVRWDPKKRPSEDEYEAFIYRLVDAESSGSGSFLAHPPDRSRATNARRASDFLNFGTILTDSECHSPLATQCRSAPSGSENHVQDRDDRRGDSSPGRGYEDWTGQASVQGRHRGARRAALLSKGLTEFPIGPQGAGLRHGQLDDTGAGRQHLVHG